jgi:hypothetical protein
MRETEININTCTHLKRICLFMQIKAKSEAIILDNITQLQHHRPLMGNKKSMTVSNKILDPGLG